MSMERTSAVKFSGNSRIHIALAVSDLDKSVKFYEELFGVKPTKIRDDYAKFEPNYPSVNLTLNRIYEPTSP